MLIMDADVIKRANRTTYGLAAGVITKNITTALSLAHNIRAGTVWVNCYDSFRACSARCWILLLTLNFRRRRALRWLQAVRHRPRARRVRPPPVLRDQDRHHQCVSFASNSALLTSSCRAAQAHRPHRVPPLNSVHKDAIAVSRLSTSKRMRHPHLAISAKCGAGYFPVSAWQALGEARWQLWYAECRTSERTHGSMRLAGKRPASLAPEINRRI